MAEGGSESFDPVDFRLKRVEADTGEVKADVKALRDELHAEIGAMRKEVRADIGELRDEIRSFCNEMRSEFAAVHRELGLVREGQSYLRGRIEQAPTTLQLLGFIIAIFVASGMTRYFGH